jgi:hypothetical protein
MEINEINGIKVKSEDFGICSCCGGTIRLEIIEGYLIRWVCGKPYLRKKCQNYGNNCKISNCPLETKEINEKRKKYRKEIEEVFFSILEEKGCIMFEEANEILHAILEMNLEDRGNFLIQKLDKENKIWKVWEAD